MRITPPTYEQMTPEQRAVHDAAVAGKRGRMPPPGLAWIHSPEMAMRVQHLGEFIRYDTIFGPALVEVAILVTAKHWRSHYEWWAHRRLAEAANLDAAIINAIRDGKPLPPSTAAAAALAEPAASGDDDDGTGAWPLRACACC